MKIFQRVLHAVAVIVIGLAALSVLALITASLVVSAYLQISVGTKPQTDNHGFWGNGLLVITLAILAGCVCAVIFKLRWRWVAFAGFAVAAALGYFAYDTPPAQLADLGPRVGGDDMGYRTMMWMAEKSPYNRLLEPGIVNAEEAKALLLPIKSEDWAEFAEKNHGIIEQAWTADKLGREWIDAINAMPPQGLWPQGNNSPIIKFQQVRATCNIRTAHAYALACEGRRDDAMAALIPMITAMYHYQQTGEGLLNEMIASVISKKCYAVAAEIVKMGAASANTRTALHEVLNKAPTVQQVIRHAILGEQDLLRGCLDQVSKESCATRVPGFVAKSRAEALLNILLKAGGKWVVFNRNRTERMIVSALAHATALAEARKLEEMKQWVPECFRSAEIKNPLGRLLFAMMVPAMSKAANGFWETEDLRLDLLKLLEEP